MAFRPSPRRATGIGAALILAALLWVSFAPRALGGSVTYVTTVGTSMEPKLYRGDLAVVRAAPAYHVGDVAAYRSRELGTLVLHRIVALDGDRFVFKGDNNSWTDGEHPERDAVIGRLILRLPGVGTWVQRLRSPVALGLGAALLVGLAARGRGRGVSLPPARGRRGNPGVATGGKIAATALFGLAGLLLAVPSNHTEQREVPYNETGVFAYSATIPGAAARAAYPGNEVRSGQPLYLRLGHELDITFAYTLGADQPVAAGGRVRLAATISDQNGWSRSLTMGKAARIGADGVAAAHGTLDVAAMQRLVAGLERVTGVARDHYLISVQAEANVRGTIGGAPVAHRFEPSLGFVLDAQELQVDRTAAATGDPFHPARGGTLPIEVPGPNRISLAGHDVSVAALRILALVLGLAAALAATLARGEADPDGMDEAAAIEARFGRWIVPATGAAAVSPIELESFDNLVTIAEQKGSVILHERTASGHDYLVEAGGTSYRYRVGPDAGTGSTGSTRSNGNGSSNGHGPHKTGA